MCIRDRGNAAAGEESMYDLGNVFGVAVLGSLSSMLYRYTHLTLPTPPYV
ncbi:hypothetical protein JMUB7552_27620 [Staphylococcus aureus]